MGIILALLINNAVLHKIGETYPLYVAMIVLGLGFGVLCCILYRHLTIISTSFIGSYAMIRPFGWLFGEFPNEFALAKQIEYGNLNRIPDEFYIYFF